MGILIIAVLIGLIPAVIAKGKGRSFGLWWFFGAALFIVALPASLIINADAAAVERTKMGEGMKKCPYCAEDDQTRGCRLPFLWARPSTTAEPTAASATGDPCSIETHYGAAKKTCCQTASGDRRLSVLQHGSAAVVD